MPPAAATDPEALRTLPPQLVAPLIDAYAAVIDYVFRWVVPVALVGFLVAWFPKEVPLRDSARANAGDVGDGFAMPHSADRVHVLERAIAAAIRSARVEGPIWPAILADADVLSSPYSRSCPPTRRGRRSEPGARSGERRPRCVCITL